MGLELFIFVFNVAEGSSTYKFTLDVVNLDSKEYLLFHEESRDSHFIWEVSKIIKGRFIIE